MGAMAALADTEAIALSVGRTAATVRWWAHKGWLERKDTGHHGRALYDVDEAAALAERLALDNAPDVHQHQDDCGVSVPPDR
jgi:hypothetical protein